MKEIIVNNNGEKKIIAVVEDAKLVEKYEEGEDNNTTIGNIYLGKIVNILPGMQAAFVDIGDNKNAFLHIKDIIPKMSHETGNKNEDLSKYNINDYVRIGMPVIVEIKKDKTDKKGAKVSTNLNLAGKYAVLMPNNNFVTISQKIGDSEDGDKIVEFVRKMKLDNYGIVVRTSAINSSEEAIKKDIENTIAVYESIVSKAGELSGKKDFSPKILYSRGGIINRLLIDIGNQNLERIVVNKAEDFGNVSKLLSDYEIKTNVELVQRESILDIYNLEGQIEKITNRKVWLKCGGFITIDKTEALTAIDVNTGKFVGKENIEKTVVKVNIEASEEIARQLRARDISGIVIIDYIDMDNKEDEDVVRDVLISELKKDRAKTQVVGFTPLHLLEMTRKQMY